ncbi:MAG: Xaa-Pro peptidase family protein [Desulfovibrio sp.]|jgi:Xaa-Pro aminopeptidase|nr:Xaa-Pro peptidase family protein [Desulfovibrio sp.]
MKPHLARRIESLQHNMRIAELDAIVFTDRENLIYYTGAVEIECMAVIIPASGEAVICCLWLDAPYVRECSGSGTIKSYRFPSSNIGSCIVTTLRSMQLPRMRIGFHKYFIEFAVFDALRSAFPSLEYLAAMDLTYKVRSVKDEMELTLIAKACSHLEVGMQAAYACIRPGITELDVLAEADYAMRKAGSEGSTFRMQVLTKSKQLRAHPFAGNKVIENNQAVVIHLGASNGGYTGKICRTVFLGDVPEETRRIYTVLQTAQEIAVRALRPGATSARIYDIVNACIQKQGYGGRFLDIIGHGVGIRQSEFYPVIGKGIDHVIKENMVVDLLLPTIYVPEAGGPRITDMLLVGSEETTFMTRFPREIFDK